jgi:hypothetical protein
MQPLFYTFKGQFVNSFELMKNVVYDLYRYPIKTAHANQYLTKSDF